MVKKLDLTNEKRQKSLNPNSCESRVLINSVSINSLLVILLLFILVIRNPDIWLTTVIPAIDFD